MLRTALRQEICPGINAPGMSNPQSCGETAAPQFLFIPNLTIAPPFSSRWSCFTGSQLLVSALGGPDDGQDATDDLDGAALLGDHDRLAAAGRPAGLLDPMNTWTMVQGVIVRKCLGDLQQAAHDRRRPRAEVAGWVFEPLRKERAERPSSRRTPGTSGDSTRRSRPVGPVRPAPLIRRACASRASSGERGPRLAPRRYTNKRSGRRR